jgi:TPR repeat protein
MPLKRPLTVLVFLVIAGSGAHAQTTIDAATLAKAQSGDAQAEYTVGDLYYGNNDAAHAADAFTWMQKAAAQNLPIATGELGLFYVVGFGTTPDPEKGRALLEQANAAGDDLAADNLAVLYANGHGDEFPQDRQKAIAYLQRSAADHNTTGEFALGYELEQGGSAAEQQKGLPYLQEAAAAGNTEAMAELGNIYNSGNSAVKPDRAEAEKYYRMATSSGDASVTAALGADLVRDGDPGGGPKDKEAAEWLAKSAAAGNPDAENYYGYILQHGRGVPEDDAGAVKWDTAAAAQGNIPATRRLGYLYSNGIGTSEDDAKAKSLLQTASAGGDIIAMRLLGQMLLGGSDADQQQAASLFAKAAAGGDPRGEADYGYVLDNGIGLQRDPSTAVVWYKKAAAQDDDYAEQSLGKMYRQGDGPIAAAPATAAGWFAKAAAAGNADAQNQLGDLNYLGEGVPKNMAKAGTLYKQSADQQFAPGETNLAECYLYGDCGARDPAKAVPLLKEAISQNDAYAENDYGWILGIGLGTPENDQQALYWDQKASAQNIAAATRRLAYFTANGIATKADPATADRLYATAANQGDVIAMRFLGEDLMNAGNQDAQAIGWLSKAAKAGDADAEVDYGYMVEHGRGTTANLQEAVTWYQRGAAQGQVNGENNLGLLYAAGDGLPKSDAEAAHWDAKAAAQGNAEAQANLGVFYYDGQGIPKNIAYSGKLFAESAAQNYPNGQANYGLCLLVGDCAAKNQAAGFALEKTAAAQGEPVAEDALGYYYLGAYGARPNKSYALLWFRLAAANGNEDAASELQKWHLTAPTQNAQTISYSTTVTGDIVPIISGSACAAHGGYGDDTYCSKDGVQIDPQSGEALSQNDSGYVNDDEVSDDDQTEIEPASAQEEYYLPSSDYGDSGGGGGYEDDGGGGGDVGGDAGDGGGD